MARAYVSGPDPRLDYPAGYGWGEALVRLSQLLRQGTDSYQNQQTVDEESQRRNQDYLLRLQQFMTGAEDRDLERKVKEGTLAVHQAQLKDLEDQRAATAADAATATEGRFRLTQLTPRIAEPMASTAGRADTSELYPNRRQPQRAMTEPEAIAASGLTPQQAGHKDVYAALQALLKAQADKAPKRTVLSEGARLVDESTGEEIAHNPKPEQPPKPPSPTSERDWHAIAEADLKKTGKPYTEDDIARGARALRMEEIKAGKQAGADILENKELPPGQRPNVVDQYGRPVQGSITPARIRDEGLLTLRPADAQAVAQVAQIQAPFGKMLDAIEKGKLPAATGGSVHDYLNAYKNNVTGTVAQFSDPTIAAFKSAQQNILFPLIRFEGGQSRQAIQELQMRMRANPSLLDTDLSAAAQAEQIAEIVETRLKAVGLTPTPELQAQLDRAHELAAKINERVSKGTPRTASPGGFWQSLTGGARSGGGAAAEADAFFQKKGMGQ